MLGCGLTVCLLVVVFLGCVTCATALCCYFGCGCDSCFWVWWLSGVLFEFGCLGFDCGGFGGFCVWISLGGLFKISGWYLLLVFRFVGLRVLIVVWVVLSAWFRCGCTFVFDLWA